MEFKHAKTKVILDWFEKINQVPRCSKNEAAICKWLMDWAKENNFEAKKDEVENVLIRVPASPGYEQSPICVIQGHMDMVCEKVKGSTHDFDKDPIKFVFTDDGWLTADGTTLGADNGIAIAMALALALDKDVQHPPLELLFTVDEETGLTGANALQPGFIEGKLLLNVDSEDEGVFTAGCAGGKDTHLEMPAPVEGAPEGHQAFKVIVGGLRGGHSGVDIAEQRANAMQVLSRVVEELSRLGDMRLATFEGGTAHNAIPRDAEALVWLDKATADKAQAKVAELDKAYKNEYATIDPKVSLSLEKTGDADRAQALSVAVTRQVMDFIQAIPHGVFAMSADIAGLVETSNNLAEIALGNGRVTALTSQRSSNMDRLDWLTTRVESVGRLCGGTAKSGGGYPSWKPNMDSQLLARCQEVYTKLFNKEPVVEVIHAGLECGIIGAKYEGMDMISFGPTIKNPHSPEECIEVETIGQIWDFMAELFKSYK